MTGSRGKLILLLGISGAGKTTTGQAAAAVAPLTYIYAATEKIALVRPGEILQRLDQARTEEVNGHLFEKLRARPGVLLVDTHATYPVGDGFVRLTPSAAAPAIGGLVLLEADPPTIRARRLARGRPHEATGLDAVAREAAAERAEVERLQRAHGLPLCRIDSAATPVEAAVRQALAFADGLAWQAR